MIKYMHDFNALRIPTAWNLEEHNLILFAPASGTSLCLLDWNLLFTRLSIWYVPSVWKQFSFWKCFLNYFKTPFGLFIVSVPTFWFIQRSWIGSVNRLALLIYLLILLWLLKNCQSCLSIHLLVYHSNFYLTYFMWILFVCSRQSLTTESRMA